MFGRESYWRGTLAIKFVALTALVASIVFSLAGAGLYYLQREAEYTRLQQKSQTLADLIASISPDRIYSFDFSTLYIYAKGLNAFQDVQYAVITDETGAPVTSYLDDNKPAIQVALKATNGDSDLSKIIPIVDALPDTKVFTQPIYLSRKLIGNVRLAVSTAVADAEIRHTLMIDVLLAVLGIVGMAIGVYLVFYRSVLRPTKRLMLGAQLVSEGDLDSHVPVPQNDKTELARLARSFNRMVDNLKTSQDEREKALLDLRDLNRTLEARVEERTRAMEKANRELERMAYYDTLTKLPNRSLLNERLTGLLSLLQGSSRNFAVCILDMDQFKEVNDTLGHHFGDELLKQAGDRLVDSLRSNDTVARLGGDEFAVLLPDTDAEKALLVANKLAKVFDSPITVDKLNCSISTSIGVAIYPQHGTDMSTLLKHADVAMYQAKEKKTGYCLYHEDMDSKKTQTFLLMAEMRGALENGEVLLYYQPLVDIASGEWRGVEALARWIHPERGFIPPDQFIPMIEQTGLIYQFTEWAIGTALAQLKTWQALGIDLTVAVNLSMRNLHDAQFIGQLSTLLRRWGVAPHCLKLEITESGVMSDPTHVLEMLEAFESMGVRMAIDDFGTGYSSLAYLKKLPVHEIKIDRSFVMDMSHDTDDAMIVKSTIDLAHNLQLSVVAEGVEDQTILDMLKSLGCDFAQGYYFSKPVPPEVLTSMMLEKKNAISQNTSPKKAGQQ